MKNNAVFCLILLLIAACLLGGCITREQAQGVPEPTPEGALATAEPATPTPEPTPAPMSFAQAVAADPVKLEQCENDDDVFDVLETLRTNAAAAPSGEPTLSAAGLSSGEPWGDSMTTDGCFLYVLAGNELVIINAQGENSEIVSRTEVGVSWKGTTDSAGGAYQGQEKVPTAVFCDGKWVAVLSESYGYKAAGGTMEYDESIRVDIYDVTDPAEPKHTAALGQDGSLRAARAEEGRLLLVTEYPIYEDARREERAGYIPSYYADETGTMLPGERIYADREGTFAGGAVIGVYDLEEGRLGDIQMLLGVRADACLGENKAILFSSRCAQAFSREVTTERGDGRESIDAACTDLFVYTLENGALSAPTVGTINGTVADERCLDIYDGAIRCLTMLDQERYTVYGSGEKTIEETVCGGALCLLDESFVPVDTLSPMPDGSDIAWAGFAGDTILLCNAEKTASCAVRTADGSFTLAGELGEGVQGRYLRRFGDNAIVLYDQNEAGRMTMTICDDTMHKLASKTFGSDHSSTLENHRAYMADGEEDLLTLTADDSYCIYGYSEEKGISLRADVFLNDWAWLAEGVRIGEHLYVADTKEVYVLSLEDLQKVQELTF